MTGPQIIVLATPVFLLAMALEFVVGVARGRNTYRLADALSSLGLGVMSQAVGVFGRRVATQGGLQGLELFALVGHASVYHV